MEKHTRTYAAYAGSLLSGAAIGAALGALFAPRSGQDTREDVGYWIKDKAHKRRVQYRDLKRALASRTRGIRSRTKRLLGA